MKPVNGKESDKPDSTMRKIARGRNRPRVSYHPQKLVDMLTMLIPKPKGIPFHGGLEVTIPFNHLKLNFLFQFSYDQTLHDDEQLYRFQVTLNTENLDFKYHPPNYIFSNIEDGKFESITQFCAYFHNILMKYAKEIDIGLRTVALQGDSPYWKTHRPELSNPFILINDKVRMNYCHPSTADYDASYELLYMKSTAPYMGECVISSESETFDNKHYYREINFKPTRLGYLYATYHTHTAEHLDFQLSFRNAPTWTALEKSKKITAINELLPFLGGSHIPPDEMHQKITSGFGKALVKTVISNSTYNKTKRRTMVEVHIRIAPNWNNQWELKYIDLFSEDKLSQYIDDQKSGYAIRGMIRHGLFRGIQINQIDQLTKNYTKLTDNDKWELFEIGNYNQLLLMMECVGLCLLRKPRSQIKDGGLLKLAASLYTFCLTQWIMRLLSQHLSRPSRPKPSQRSYSPSSRKKYLNGSERKPKDHEKVIVDFKKV